MGPNLAKKIANPKTPFESYIQYNRSDFHGSEHTGEGLKNALANLNLDKRPGWDSISSNVVKDISNEMSYS